MKRLNPHLQKSLRFLPAAGCLLGSAIHLPAAVVTDKPIALHERPPIVASFTLRPQGGEFIQRWLLLGPVGTEPARTNVSGTAAQTHVMQTDYLTGVQGEAGVRP